MNLTIKILEELKQNKGYIKIWNYFDSDSFYCGQVLDYTEELLILQHYTKFGIKDGTKVIRIPDIKTISYNDDYTEAMSYLIKNAEKIAQQTDFEFDYIHDESWRFTLLKQLQGKTDIITSIEIDNNEYFSGFIKDVDEENVLLQFIGTLGEEEGTELYKIEDIRGLKINDIDNRKRLLLYNWRKMK